MIKKHTTSLMKTALISMISIILLASCGSIDPNVGVKYLEAINLGDLDQADQYVCASQAGELSEKIQKRSNTPTKGQDVLGLTSPGMTEIKCEKTSSSELTCTFWSPELQCTGNLLAGDPITCTSWKTKGEQKTILLIFEDGKICDYD
jgi:hypothetical protein